MERPFRAVPTLYRGIDEGLRVTSDIAKSDAIRAVEELAGIETEEPVEVVRSLQEVARLAIERAEAILALLSADVQLTTE